MLILLCVCVCVLVGNAGSASNGAAQHGSAPKPVQPEPVPVSRFWSSSGERLIRNMFFKDQQHWCFFTNVLNISVEQWLQISLISMSVLLLCLKVSASLPVSGPFLSCLFKSSVMFRCPLHRCSTVRRFRLHPQVLHPAFRLLHKSRLRPSTKPHPRQLRDARLLLVRLRLLCLAIRRPSHIRPTRPSWPRPPHSSSWTEPVRCSRMEAEPLNRCLCPPRMLWGRTHSLSLR